MLRMFLCTIRVADTIVEYRAIAATTKSEAYFSAAGAYREAHGVADLTITAERISDEIAAQFLATPGTLIDPAVAAMALMLQRATDKLRRAGVE